MSAAPRSPAEPCPANSGRDAFRRRAAAALTHPLTLAALATLIVNDIALKRAFPDAWATGKISDLAWMVFAPPLLAYALSLLAGRSALGRRAGFGIAYAGLPLLYAAFNTFEPVHDAILRGLALVGGLRRRKRQRNSGDGNARRCGHRSGWSMEDGRRGPVRADRFLIGQQTARARKLFVPVVRLCACGVVR